MFGVIGMTLLGTGVGFILQARRDVKRRLSRISALLCMGTGGFLTASALDVGGIWGALAGVLVVGLLV